MHGYGTMEVARKKRRWKRGEKRKSVLNDARQFINQLLFVKERKEKRKKKNWIAKEFSFIHPQASGNLCSFKLFEALTMKDNRWNETFDVLCWREKLFSSDFKEDNSSCCGL